MTTTENIVDSIERRIRDANQEIVALTAARAALNGRPGTKGRSAVTAAGVKRVAAEPQGESRSPAEKTAPAPSRRQRKHSRRTSFARAVQVVPAGKLEVLLAESAGLTTSALAQQAGADRDQVLTLLQEMEAMGRVRRQGERRATRWRAITDEERIQERAAELEAQRKPTAKPD